MTPRKSTQPPASTRPIAVRPPRKETTKVVNFRVTPAFRQELRQLALDRNETLSQTFQEAISALRRTMAR